MHLCRCGKVLIKMWFVGKAPIVLNHESAGHDKITHWFIKQWVIYICGIQYNQHQYLHLSENINDFLYTTNRLNTLFYNCQGHQKANLRRNLHLFQSDFQLVYQIIYRYSFQNYNLQYTYSIYAAYLFTDSIWFQTQRYC